MTTNQPPPATLTPQSEAASRPAPARESFGPQHGTAPLQSGAAVDTAPSPRTDAQIQAAAPPRTDNAVPTAAPPTDTPAQTVPPARADTPVQTAARLPTPAPPEPRSEPAPASEPTARQAPQQDAGAAKPESNLDFADIAAAIEGLPTDAAAPTARPSSTPQPGPAQTAAQAPQPGPVAAEPAAGDAPTRHWVQIASAPDNLVDHEYRRLKRKHPGLLSDKEGYRTPMGRSNRVLVGPFESEDAAKAFVGELKKDSLTAIAWTSPAGHGIDKIPSGQR